MFFLQNTSPSRQKDRPSVSRVGKGYLANDPGQKIEILENKKTGEFMPKVLHREVTTVLEDGTKNIQITIDGSRSGEVEKIIERVRRREGLTPLSDDDLKAEAKRAISAPRSE